MARHPTVLLALPGDAATLRVAALIGGSEARGVQVHRKAWPPTTVRSASHDRGPRPDAGAMPRLTRWLALVRLGEAPLPGKAPRMGRQPFAGNCPSVRVHCHKAKDSSRMPCAMCDSIADVHGVCGRGGGSGASSPCLRRRRPSEDPRDAAAVQASPHCRHLIQSRRVEVASASVWA